MSEDDWLLVIIGGVGLVLVWKVMETIQAGAEVVGGLAKTPANVVDTTFKSGTLFVKAAGEAYESAVKTTVQHALQVKEEIDQTIQDVEARVVEVGRDTGETAKAAVLTSVTYPLVVYNNTVGAANTAIVNVVKSGADQVANVLSEATKQEGNMITSIQGWYAAQPKYDAAEHTGGGGLLGGWFK